MLLLTSDSQGYECHPYRIWLCFLISNMFSYHWMGWSLGNILCLLFLDVIPTILLEMILPRALISSLKLLLRGQLFVVEMIFLWLACLWSVSVCVCVCVFSVTQSCPTLCNLMDRSWPGSSVCGISQARVWSGLPFPSPGDLPDPGIKPGSPALTGGFFTTEPPGWPPSFQFFPPNKLPRII